MSMSRKHYTETARILNSYVPDVTPGVNGAADTQRAVVTGIADEMATMFKADNRAFDRARFFAACGLEDLNAS